jgi:uncharacterized protein YegP (UPF0339 family)
MKTLLTFVILLFTTISFGQKREDYLISYIDTSSGQELIGFKSKNGKIIIKAEFYHTYTDTFYTVAIVLKNSEWVGIDKNENILFNVYVFDNGPDYPSDGLFRIIKDSKIGYADLNGNIVIKPKLDCAYPFKNGRARVGIGCKVNSDGEHSWWTGGKWYSINKKGEIIIK